MNLPALRPMRPDTAADWPELVPLNTHNLPRLSSTSLRGWAGEFVCAS
jgi:hypothetical protein